jgi:hypothetical protein
VQESQFGGIRLRHASEAHHPKYQPRTIWGSNEMISYTYQVTVHHDKCLTAQIFASDVTEVIGYVTCHRRYMRWRCLRPRWQTDQEFVDDFHRAVVAEIIRIRKDRATAKKLKRLTNAGKRLAVPPSWPLPER